MKKTLTLAVLCGLLFAAVAQEAPKKVLFIGNSYTEVNNLPLLVQKAAESAGCHMTYQSNTPGGCTFEQHCSNQSMTLIRKGGWDVVVLQEQSQLPSFPQSQVEAECLPFAAELVDSVYACNPDGEAMFYMTWGRKNGDSRNAQYFPVLGSYEGMDSMLYTRYMYMARENDASVCPVGRVWRNIRSNHREIELYQSDESHPSMAGSYAGACAFYTMIFHSNPNEITFTPEELDPEQAATIRGVVERVVFDSLSFWLRQDTTVVGIAPMAEKAGCRVFPNPASDRVTVCVSQMALPGRAALYDVKGCLVRSLLLCQPEEVISTAALAPGVYTLKVVSGAETASVRIVKN